MMRHIHFIAISGVLLGGCATTSFAPPIINQARELKFTRTQTSFNAVCTPDYKAADARDIRENVEGALILISNYVLTYKCQRDRAAEGRQYFEVPAFLGTVGAATAAALGAGPAVAIAAGAGSATLDHGKQYYAPRDKAQVLNDAVDALYCIQNEAVGIDAYTVKAISDVQGASGAGSGDDAKPKPGARMTEDGRPLPDDGGPSVPVTAQVQYFKAISGALGMVDNLTAARLNNSGKLFDLDGIANKIAELKQQEKDAKDEAGTAANAAKPIVDAPPPAAPAATAGAEEKIMATSRTMLFNNARARVRAFDPAQVGLTMIKLKVLQPRLQQCILRVKVGSAS